MSSNAPNKQNISLQNKYDRIILLVDMDCFYCQVEEKLNPEFKGQPLAVVQYNAWRGGGIIAVNYAARAQGVTRHMRGDEAKEQCPDIILVKVPNVREKADLSKYRDAGKEVANVLQRFTPLLERASVDEAYLDITEEVNKRLANMNTGSFLIQPSELVNTYAQGYTDIQSYISKITATFANPNCNDEALYSQYLETDVPAVRQSDIRLLIGAAIAGEIRAAVKKETEYECSAGIAHNKILAKLACGMNKPNKQTILPLDQIPVLFETLPVNKIKGLGAKFGEEVCEKLNIRFLGQLFKFTESELQRKFDEKNGSWLYYICRGIDLEPVTPRFYSKSIGCCKKFPGRNNITGLKTLQHWLNELAIEIAERLEKDIEENNRKAKQMVVNFIQEFEGVEVSSSRSTALNSYECEHMSKLCLDVIRANTKQFFRAGSETVLNNPIKFLGISVGKFETIDAAQSKLQQMFAKQAAKKLKTSSEIRSEEEVKRSSAEVAKDIKSFLSNSNTQTKEVILDTKVSATTKSESPTIKSFFLNALKKVQTNNTNNHHTMNSETKISIDTASDDLITLPIANNGSTDETKLQIESNASKSFFVKALLKQKLLNNSEINLSQNPILKSDTSSEEDSQDALVITNVPNEMSSITEQDCESETSNANTMEQNENLNIFEDINHSMDEVEELEAQLKQIDAENEEKTNENLEKDLNDQNEPNNNDNNHSKNLSNFQITEVQKESITNHSLKRKFEALNETNSSKPSNAYQTEYVEFALPQVDLSHISYYKCDQCGAKIVNDPKLRQYHEDHHFALKLSQAEREEFRANIKQKFKNNISPSNAKKTKKSSSSPAANPQNKSKNNITKFLVNPNDSINCTMEPSTSATAAESLANKEMCAQCQTLIEKHEMQAHLDFHVAKELQRKLNQLEVRTVTVSKKSTNNLNKKINSVLNTTQKEAKPITKFFSQSQSSL